MALRFIAACQRLKTKSQMFGGLIPSFGRDTRGRTGTGSFLLTRVKVSKLKVNLRLI